MKPFSSSVRSWWATDDELVEPDLLADLAHARRVAAAADGLVDHGEDALLARGQPAGVRRAVGQLADDRARGPLRAALPVVRRASRRPCPKRSRTCRTLAGGGVPAGGHGAPSLGTRGRHVSPAHRRLQTCVRTARVAHAVVQPADGPDACEHVFDETLAWGRVRPYGRTQFRSNVRSTAVEGSSHQNCRRASLEPGSWTTETSRPGGRGRPSGEEARDEHHHDDTHGTHARTHAPGPHAGTRSGDGLPRGTDPLHAPHGPPARGTLRRD